MAAGKRKNKNRDEMLEDKSLSHIEPSSSLTLVQEWAVFNYKDAVSMLAVITLLLAMILIIFSRNDGAEDDCEAHWNRKKVWPKEFENLCLVSRAVLGNTLQKYSSKLSLSSRICEKLPVSFLSARQEPAKSTVSFRQMLSVYKNMPKE